MRYLIKYYFSIKFHAVQPAFKNDGLHTELRQYLHGLLSDAAEWLPATFWVRLLYEAKCSESLEMTRLRPTLYPTSNHSITLSPHLKHRKIYANKILWLTSNKNNPKSYNVDMQHSTSSVWTMEHDPKSIRLRYLQTLIQLQQDPVFEQNAWWVCSNYSAALRCNAKPNSWETIPNTARRLTISQRYIQCPLCPAAA